MSKLKPYIEKLLKEVIVAPIMLVTHRDVTLFKDDPIEYIRKQYDFTETLFSPKNTVVDLLNYLCKYKSTRKQRQPDYLYSFLEFCGRNMDQFTLAVANGQGASFDWRIKEAILYAIGSLMEEISPYK